MAVVGSVVRNVILNWLVLLPLTAAVLLALIIAASVAAANVSASPGSLDLVLLVVAFVSGALATAYIGFDLPSAGDPKLGSTGTCGSA